MLLSVLRHVSVSSLLIEGKRYSLPNSRIMIHQPLGGAQGGQTDIDIQVPLSLAYAPSFVFVSHILM